MKVKPKSFLYKFLNSGDPLYLVPIDMSHLLLEAIRLKIQIPEGQFTIVESNDVLSVVPVEYSLGRIFDCMVDEAQNEAVGINNWIFVVAVVVFFLPSSDLA